MYDAGKVSLGLIIFLVIVTTPVWYHLVKGAEEGPPQLTIATESRECVAPKEYMRTLHMDLLNKWRDDVVRAGDRIHVGPGGVAYDKSLSRTCMNCHANKSEFCDRCHAYAAVTPVCWDCHVEPRETQ